MGRATADARVSAFVRAMRLGTSSPEDHGQVRDDENNERDPQEIAAGGKERELEKPCPGFPRCRCPPECPGKNSPKSDADLYH